MRKRKSALIEGVGAIARSHHLDRGSVAIATVQQTEIRAASAIRRSIAARVHHAARRGDSDVVDGNADELYVELHADEKFTPP